MYLNYKSFSVDFNEKTLEFRTFISGVQDSSESCFIDAGKISIVNFEGTELELADFSNSSLSQNMSLKSGQIRLLLTGGPVSTPDLDITFTANSHSLKLSAVGRAYVTFSGKLFWGKDMENSTFSVRTGTQSSVLHTACGPATSPYDNALFDRLSDSILHYSTAGHMKLDFNWQDKCYDFTHTNGLDHGRELEFSVRKNHISSLYNAPYAANKFTHQFKTPPVGWMTWYALKFTCCREKVLDNAHKFVSEFKKYCEKPVIWVDWEWCHKCFDGQGEEGADIFHPRKDAYPDGVAEISEAIRKEGAIPAFWIGATNEGAINEELAKHPDWVLAQKAVWCGQYWVDLSNPEVREKYIKKIFQQILDWGFEVVKWDCLPMTLEMLSTFHDKMHDRSISPHQALRLTIEAAREVLGNGRYLLSCSGSSERDTTFATDLFDAARIGGDIFTWQDYLDQAVDLVLHYYPLHNTAYYADADNLVLREEFNNIRQARSRISFYGLAGLPVTLGDEMDALDAERIDMLKRIMPVVSLHSAEPEIKQRSQRYQTVNSSFCKKFGSWNVCGVTNFNDVTCRIKVDTKSDLQLDPSARYALFDFWNQTFTGICSGTFELDIAACDTSVLRVTRLGDHSVELIGSNRHITQGEVEINDIIRQENRMEFSVNCIEGEELILTLYLADDVADFSAEVPFERDGNICKLTVSGCGKVTFGAEYTLK